MKKVKILIALMLVYALGLAQQTTTTTTTTTNQENVIQPGTDVNGNEPGNDCRKGFIGIRYLPTLSSVDLAQPAYGTVKTTFVLGHGMGVYLGYNFSKNVGAQVEILYSALSQKITVNNVNSRLDLSYVNIPLLLSLNTNSCGRVNFNLVAGPQLGIKTGSSLKTEGSGGMDTVSAVLAVKPGDLGIAYGLGIDFAITPVVNLGIGFRGVYGLVDISKNSNNTTTDQYYILDRSHLQTYAGYVGLGFKF